MRTVQTLFPDQFEAYRQHDAAEFLRSVLARLHEEMEAQIRASHVVPSGLIRETTTSRTTIVHELFEGMLQSHVKCSECGKVECESGCTVVST